ncbi:MAG: type II toxin-antitoxin system HicA family toxin [Acidobacteria bacterium]|nr:type II toxin-antitoxin system HicA family toxin [Acidobacteriota bacterium]MCG2815360.1 type II toxin-antitoxin system HicA family toxin [Candidatus Aminicenantes bacterium]
MKRKDLEKVLRSRGWELARQGRKHDIWTNGTLEIAVPRHKEINEYTAKAILKLTEGESK